MLEKLLSIAASPLSFVLLIGIVVTVHELGHYWAGRLFGAAIESFSVGFGGSLLEVRDRRGTRWRINWLPLGGFVKFAGEMQAPSDSRAVGTTDLTGCAFHELHPLKRLVISLGGPAANFIFAILALATLAMITGLPEAQAVRVAEVQAASPAEAAGFRKGDLILEAGGRAVSTGGDVIRATALSAGESVVYLVERGGERLTLTAVPETREERSEAFKVVEKIGRVGLSLEDVDLDVRRPGLLEAAAYGVSATGEAIGSTVTVLRRLVTGLDGIDRLSGPVGIFGIADNATDLHMKQTELSFLERLANVSLTLLQLAALFSIGVGFFNLLPIPVLDGGAAVMCLAEAATGREIPEAIQRIGLTIGLACLIGFAVVVTWNDVTRPGGPLEVLSGMLS